ncbi:SRPBCC domain-containing protein [Saccharothrix sp. HUAS TT1]|uniref:SRPBCC domain-containing protein n=1 Tax=unclassified Saccharothrix TaxID=2593673 RepID=UPI00345BD64E
MGNPRLELSPVVATTMLIRRPRAEVFRAFTDPAITSRFWFTRSSGPVAPGARLRWTWEMYDVSVTVQVKEFEQDHRFAVEWQNGPRPTTFELRFTDHSTDATRVDLTETGFGGDDPDEVVTWALNSMGGFTEALAAAKALLEHDIVLTLVADRHPDGIAGS